MLTHRKGHFLKVSTAIGRVELKKIQSSGNKKESIFCNQNALFLVLFFRAIYYVQKVVLMLYLVCYEVSKPTVNQYYIIRLMIRQY